MRVNNELKPGLQANPVRDVDASIGTPGFGE
jgi:hypothetical protein